MISFKDLKDYRNDRKEVKKLLAPDNRNFW